MDLRIEVFLVGETMVDSVIVVSAGEIALSAIAGLIGIFSVLASLALDTHITTHTTITPITIHTTVTRISIERSCLTNNFCNKKSSDPTGSGTFLSLTVFL